MINDDNPYYKTEGGNDTSDKVYFLSIGEAQTTTYGFSENFTAADQAREAKPTAYARAQGASVSGSSGTAGNCRWFLRSPGNYSNCASNVYSDGGGYRDGYIVYDENAVRPALHLNLSSFFSYAGTVTSDGTKDERHIHQWSEEYHSGNADEQRHYRTCTVEGCAAKDFGAPHTWNCEAATAEQDKHCTVCGYIAELRGGVVLHNPYKDIYGNTAWDCVWFGHYWQNDTNADGTADQKDDREGIKWRVLSREGNTLLLLADMALDCQPYNDKWTDVTWENCTLRAWLNDSFLNNAFSAEEQANIQTTTVINDDNPYYKTEGGNDTSDKVYLLSIKEAQTTAYGFNGNFTASDKAREAKPTAYAKAQGVSVSGSSGTAGNCWWWVRSPGRYSYGASYVDNDGGGDSYGGPVDYEGAVRPALRLNLSSSLFSYAGTVSSDGTKEEIGDGGTVSGGGIIGGGAGEHTHQSTAVEPREPGCTEPGYKAYYTCTCGKYFEDAVCQTEITDLTAWKAEGGRGYLAPGHKYGTEWIIDKQPTATESGSKSHHCTVCGAKKDVTAIPVTGKPATGETGNDPTKDPSGTEKPSGNPSNNPSSNAGSQTGQSKPKGAVITPKGSAFTYKVTAAGNTPTVALTKAAAKSTSVTIPATIKDENGIVYEVTSIAANAMKNNKKVKTVKIGQNVTSIGKNAFSGCTKLKTITISGTKVKTIGKNAFKKVKSSAVVKTPKSKKKAYKTLLKKAGFKGKVK